MSDRSEFLAARPTRTPAGGRRDAGMTLPELLITITVLGLVTAALAASLVVTFRTSDNTSGRLNVARGEQSIDYYLPNDLASAADVDTSPDASPCADACPAGLDLDGSNALMLTWTTVRSNGVDPVTVVTNVSYYFNETDTPGVYQLRRIECTSTSGGAWECTVIRVLSGITLTTDWGPGDPVPPNVMEVSEPLAPDAVDDSESSNATAAQRKNANRVIVTINGGGDAAGAGGGNNRISITAGGTQRETIPADSITNAPTFNEARSKCGGPIVLIVDDSGSIGSAMGTVKTGVKKFIETFAGTPTQIQVVRFDSTSGVVGGGGAWTKYFDMTDDTQVSALINAVDPALVADGGTNWEDAWFRSFYQQNGQDFLQVQPKLAVFFTDGEPTYERLRVRASGGGDIPTQPLPEAGYPTYSGGYYSNGQDYSQVAFNRAKWIVDQIRASTRVIGVGVGPAFSQSSDWIDSPGRGWHWEYQRGDRRYQSASRIYERATGFQSNLDFEKATAFQSNLDFEKATGFQSNLDFEKATGFQSNLDFEKATAFQSNLDFEKGNAFQSNSDFEVGSAFQSNINYQSKVDFETKPSQNGTYTDATLTQYLNANQNRRRIWTDTRAPANVSAEQYWQYRSTLGSASDWLVNGTRANYTVLEATYDAHNTSTDFSDGWQVSVWTDTDPTTYYTNQPPRPDKYRVNTPSDRSNSGGNTGRWFTVTEAEYDAYHSQSATNWQINGWGDTDPTTYYTNQPTQTTKYRIHSPSDRSNANGNTGRWFTVTEAEYDAYRSQSANSWQISGWTDTDPTTYYTNQPAQTAKYRIHSPSDRSNSGGNTGRWFTVTEAEYDAYHSQSASNWQFTWADTDPTTYYTNQPTHTAKYRINSPSDRSNANGNTGRWFTVTEAEYDAYRSQSANNWQISGWTDTTPTIYYNGIAGNTPLAAKYRIQTPSNRSNSGGNTGRWFTVTEAEYDAYRSQSANNWQISGWTDTTPTIYYNGIAGNTPLAAKYRIQTPSNRSNSGGNTGRWFTVTQTEFNNYRVQSPSNWQISGWSTITQSQYDTGNTTADESDGFRFRFDTWQWISTAEYIAPGHNTTPDESDGYRDAGKQYVTSDSDATDWEPTSGNRTDGGYRRIQQYTPPYDSYEAAVEFSKPNSEILTRLVTGQDLGVTWNGAVPGNAEDADLFLLPDFDNFASALQSVALGECGGTLTVSTKIGTQRAADPFTYQDSRVANAAGTDLQVLPTTVTTSRSSPTGTFDFDVPGGSFVTVDVLPVNLSQLNAYNPGTWSCKAGITPITSIQPVPIDDVEHPGWTGVRVRVGANQAVSCTMNVTLRT